MQGSMFGQKVCNRYCVNSSENIHWEVFWNKGALKDTSDVVHC